MESSNKKSYVRFSGDLMVAYLYLMPPENNYPYTLNSVIDFLEKNNVKSGYLEDVIEEMIRNQDYMHEIKVAVGILPVDGIDGYYDFHFNRNPAAHPKMNEDGSVNYWSLNSLENVYKGQVIATYVPAVQGSAGMNVKGKPILGKRAKELPILKGKGFDRTEDNLVYTSNMDGKIEYKNDRINITGIYEVFGNVDLSVGNIDFPGDVIIHGTVVTGITIKVSGSITIDGNVEAAQLIAGKDIILRSGMVGGTDAYVSSQGSIFAKFFEHTKIEAKYSIQADFIMNCIVKSGEKIVLTGKRGTIVGGSVSAIQAIEVADLGNQAQKRTEVFVGISHETHQRAAILEKKIDAIKQNLIKIEKGISDLENFEKAGGTSGVDPRRVQLLRVKIQESATLSNNQEELEEIKALIRKDQNVYISVSKNVYPGVVIGIDDERLVVKEENTSVEFRKHIDRILMYEIMQGNGK